MIKPRIIKFLVAPVIAIGACWVANQADATMVTLEPTGKITSGSQVETYFDGGTDSFNNPGNGDPAGPVDYVIFPTGGTNGAGTFNTTYFDSLSAGKVTGALPSGASDVFYQSVASTMNFASGYAATSLSFDYSTYAASGPTVTVWSGANGTGLSTVVNLTQNDFTSGANSNCTTSHFCTWTASTVNLATIGGIAESVTFGGSLIGEVDFDSIAMNVVPVPLPAALPLLISGLAGFGALARRRKASFS